ncbi:MAG: CapA family protein [Ruminococcus sp.]|nr:CapA family protein [Ruminococcus sp.]
MKIFICGDICPTADYRQLFDNPQKLFGNMAELINDSDYAVCNFECPATDSSDRIMKTGPSLKAEKKDLKMLKDMGFDAISIANNHILDYGFKGVAETLETAKDCGLAVFGGGKNSYEAKKPLITEIEGKKIAFVSFAEHEFNIATADTPGANLFDPYVSLEQIRIIKKQCDYLIVLYHGGIEHYIYPSLLLQKKCRAMVDFGADLVLCQHSHCIGTREEYNDATIVYGQGNCIFGYREGDKAWNEGFAIQVEITDKMNVIYHLINATKDGVAIVDGNSRVEKFFEDSEKLSDKDFLQKEFSEFCKKRSALDMPLFYGKNRVLIKLNRIFGGKLFKPSKRKLMVTHNLIRCDAWNEVMQEDLRGAFYE